MHTQCIAMHQCHAKNQVTYPQSKSLTNAQCTKRQVELATADVYFRDGEREREYDANNVVGS
jgi:hypothetical protein